MKTAALLLLLLACFGRAFAFDSAHFTVDCASGVDIPAVIGHLDIGATDALLAGKASGASESLDQEFSRMLDTLFIRVCDILDMRLYSFHGNIKICRDQAELEKIYLGLYEQGLDSSVHAFYSQSLNTVYVSAAGVTRSILGHEIAHAVISHYFVVLPSVRIQEVLAGYVEYQLRKDPDPVKSSELS